MKARTRIFALALALLMIGALFVGCGPTEEPKSTTSTTPVSTTAAPSTTAPQSTQTETTPETTDAPFNAEGYVFLFGGARRYDPATSPGTAMAAELKSIYAKIEKELNCYVEFVTEYKLEQLVSAVVGGEKIVDFNRGPQAVWIGLSMNDYIYALDDPMFVDAGLELNNEDVFFQHYTHLSDINGHTWGVDMSGRFERMNFGHVFAFNKKLCEEAGYPADTLFQKVYDMQWNYDYFLEVARAIQNNTDPDDIIWGVALDCDGNEVWTNGPGPIIMKDGKWTENTMAPNVQAALEFMYLLNDKGALSPELFKADGSQIVGRGDRRRMFYGGKAGFAGLYGPNFGEGGTMNMSDPAGLLPMPKGSDADKYIMNFVGTDLYFMPKSVKEYEKSARIISAIGRAVHDKDEYYNFLFYESMLECEDSYKVLTEYLLPNGIMNIAKASADLHTIMRDGFYSDVYDGQKTPQQSAETYSAAIQNELDRLFKQ